LSRPAAHRRHEAIARTSRKAARFGLRPAASRRCRGAAYAAALPAALIGDGGDAA